MVGGDDRVWIGSTTPTRHVSITGIDNHQIPVVPIGTIGVFAMSNRGPVILIFNKVAYTCKHKYIISSTQLEHYHNRVDDRSTLAGGTQCISTADGYIFPLSIKEGLPYLKMRPCTQHVIIRWNGKAVSVITMAPLGIAVF